MNAWFESNYHLNLSILYWVLNKFHAINLICVVIYFRAEG